MAASDINSTYSRMTGFQQPGETWKTPQSPLTCFKPPEEISEAEKFANGGAWFGQYARWAARFYYNEQAPTFNANRNGITNYSRGKANEMVENLSFYFGQQANTTFNAESLTPQGNTVQAPFVPGQKIRQLIEHVVGNIITMVEPMESGISAVSMTEDVVKDKQNRIDNAMMAVEMQERGFTFEEVQFQPERKSYQSVDEVKEDAETWEHEYEEMAVNMTRSLYFSNYLKDKFIDVGENTLIGNLGAIHVYVDDAGNVCADSIPCYTNIFDNRCNDQHGRGQRFAGFISFKTPAEIFAEYPGLNAQAREEILSMMGATTEATAFCNYYNQSFPNFMCWDRESGLVACIKMYFICRRDLRWRQTTDYYTKAPYLKKIDDDAEYSIGEVKKKGKDISGDRWIWDVAVVDLIGGRYPVGYGYNPCVVRPPQKRAIPELPIINFAQGIKMSHTRSFVSRLKGNQQLKDYYRFKILEKAGQDMGRNVVWFGHRFSGTDLEDIIEDFKSHNMTVLDGITGQKNDPTNADKLAEVIDLSLDKNVLAYERLCNMEDREMEAMVNIPSAALGQQNRTGMGVLKNNIVQSTLGQKSLYMGLHDTYVQVLQYMFNAFKEVVASDKKYQDSGVVIPISDRQAVLIKATKQFRAQDMGIWVRANDQIEGENKEMLKGMLQAFTQNMQNPQVSKGLEIGLGIMQSKTFDDAIKRLKKHNKEQEKKAMEIGSQQQQAQQQQAMEIQNQQNETLLLLTQFKEDNANFRTKYTADMNAYAKALQEIVKQIPLPAEPAPIAPPPQQPQPQQ